MIEYSKFKKPKGDFTYFVDEESKLLFLKKMKIIPKTAKKIKPLFYNGLYSSDYCLCNVVGYESENTLIIEIHKHLHCINTDCIIEMQPLVKDIENIIKRIGEIQND